MEASMSRDIDRREFVVSGTLAAAALARPSGVAGAPAIHRRRALPVVIASANGNDSRDASGVTCVARAYQRITEGGDVLDALVAGVNIVELDPEDSSVGFGGLPNADGVVQLDSCCMHGPRRQAGGVASLEGVRTPSLVAKAVMELTDHHLLVGKGAAEFADRLGFTVEDDLNTDHSRQMWLEWKRRIDPDHWLDPIKRMELGYQAGLDMVHEGLINPEHFYGTINCNGVNANGDVCGVTTTSGLAWKIPGRVGDSPILGAGLYVDNDVGAAGSTGRGEANLYNLTSYLIVENMRRGMAPLDAGLDGLRRIQKNTIEKRLLNSRGLPAFGINFYVVNKAGEYAGVSMYGGPRFAVCDSNGPRTEECTPLLEGRASGD
jgi:N4-(beta-N-acetylglucosaminyl)-L-asparaginase